ncbi:hypothetical protein XaC1_388 [Xanthomonas phage XaC1]|nr:hypothetical protein XaC1_388 [Xanthomonas phage XaC1]
MKYSDEELAASILRTKKQAKERDLRLRTVVTCDDLLKEILDSRNEYNPSRLHVLNTYGKEKSNFKTSRCASLYFNKIDNLTMIVNLNNYIFRFNGTVITYLNYNKFDLDLVDVNEDDLFSLSTIYENIDVIYRFKQFFLTLDSMRLKRKKEIDEKWLVDKRPYRLRNDLYGNDYDLRSLL